MKFIACILIACMFYMPGPCVAIPLHVFLSGTAPSGAVDNPINNAVFGGSQYLRTSTMTGLTDGKTGTISFWYKCNGGDSTTRRLLFIGTGSGGQRFSVNHRSVNTISIVGLNVGGTTILDMRSTSTILAGSGWIHIMACWDLANSSNRAIYFNGVAETVDAATYTNDDIDYNPSSPTITICGDSTTSPIQIATGALGEMWFNDSYNNVIGDYYSGGLAVQLGSDGSTPTGSQPVLYLSSSGSGNSWNNNGTAGSMTRSGTLTTDADPPDLVP